MSNLLKHILTAFALVVISLGVAGKSQAMPIVLTVINSAQTVSQDARFTFSGIDTNLESQPSTIGAIELREPFPDSVSLAAGFFVHPVPALTTERGDVVTFAIPGNVAPGLYRRIIRLPGPFPSGGPGKVGAAVSEPVTMILFGTGLLGLATKVRSRRKKLRSQD